MTSVSLPYIHRYADRHGKVRYYFRRSGYNKVALPGEPGSNEFLRTYQDALELSKGPRQAGKDKVIPRSFSDLVIKYYDSLDFADNSPITQRTYRNSLERMRTTFGDFPISSITTLNIKSLMQKKVSTPAAANTLLKMFRIVLRLAVELNWRTDNPALGIKRVDTESDGYPTWPEEEIGKYEAHWPVGTQPRLAFDLLLHTGQRSADVRQMGRQNLSADGNFIILRQQKGRRSRTKKTLWIPITPSLRASLDRVPVDQMSFLLAKFEKPFTERGFGNYIVRRAAMAGVQKGLTAHGLRKSTATRLANAGCSESQIMSITGHASAKEVQRYTQAANQKLLATSAYAKVATMLGVDADEKSDD